MTEDTSPENLRKFLESDDPALVWMGLSMAKNIDIPEELYTQIFGLSLWTLDEEAREVAEEIVADIGLENIKEFPEWKWDLDLELREQVTEDLSCIEDGRVNRPLLGAIEELSYSPDPQEECIVRHNIVSGLGFKGNKTAKDAVIGFLGDSDETVKEAAAWSLAYIGDKDVIEILLQGIESPNDECDASNAEDAFLSALLSFKDKKVVKELIRIYENTPETYHTHQIIKKELEKLGV